MGLILLALFLILSKLFSLRVEIVGVSSFCSKFNFFVISVCSSVDVFPLPLSSFSKMFFSFFFGHFSYNIFLSKNLFLKLFLHIFFCKNLMSSFLFIVFGKERISVFLFLTEFDEENEESKVDSLFLTNFYV